MNWRCCWKYSSESFWLDTTSSSAVCVTLRKKPLRRSFLFLPRTLNYPEVTFRYDLKLVCFILISLTSWSYSRKTLKLTSLRRLGCSAHRCKNTSCMATVFLNVARYSLKRQRYFKITSRTLWMVKGLRLSYASSSCFIFWNSSRVIVASPSPNFCSFSREASKSGRGGAGGIYKMSCKVNRENHFLALTYDDAGIVFVFFISIVKPYKFFVLPHNWKLRLFKIRKSRLKLSTHRQKLTRKS